jgi:hypothetical protein
MGVNMIGRSPSPEVPKENKMASCAKCGKGKIKRRDGMRKCKHCGPLPEPMVNGEKAANPFGSCFDAAAYNLLANYESGIENMTMCHGIGTANYPGQEGKRICHAWIEFDHAQGRAAIDPIWLIAQPAELYRTNLKVELVIEYSKQQFMKTWLDTDYPGPWDARIMALTKGEKSHAA